MGFTLPTSNASADHAKALIEKKTALEAEIDEHLSVLRANGCTMKTPLVDAEGFPRDDIDVYQVRVARNKIIELRNDLEALMRDIQKALEGVYDPAAAREDGATSSTGIISKPFAKVDTVAPSSPAADAGLQPDDLILEFGSLDSSSFTSSSLQPLATLVADNENRTLRIKVLRPKSEQIVVLRFTPRKNWGGRGMLGCLVVRYTPP